MGDRSFGHTVVTNVVRSSCHLKSLNRSQHQFNNVHPSSECSQAVKRAQHGQCEQNNEILDLFMECCLA